MAAQSNTPVRKEDGAIEAVRLSGAQVDVFLARVQTITPATAIAVYGTGGRKALQDFGTATKSDSAVRILKKRT